MLRNLAESGAEYAGIILLVDDEPLVLEYAGTLLASHGYPVITANGGETALRLAESCSEIALLVTDVQMPGMSGVALARRLKSEKPDLRVLLMSAADPDEFVVDTSFGFMAKPFTPHDLYHAVASMLSQASAGTTCGGRGAGR